VVSPIGGASQPVSRVSDGKRTFFKTELISLGAGISVLISVGR
jgi:hypothetical protein